jgi:hypothetical protein
MRASVRALSEPEPAPSRLAAVGLGMESRARGWRRGTVIVLLLAAAIMFAVWRIADRISVHL